MRPKLQIHWMGVLALFTLSSLSGHSAEPIESIPDFGSHWLKSPWIRSQESGSGVIEAKVFERLIQTDSQVYPVGTVTYFKYPKQIIAAKFTYEQVLDTLKVGMGMPFWIQRTLGRTHVYEGEWVALGRFIQIYVRENSDSVEYSVAMMRMSYMLPTAVDAEIIQRELFHELPLSHKKNWLDGILTDLHRIESTIVAESYAGACDCSGAAILTNPTCAKQCLQGLGSGTSGTSSTPGITGSGVLGSITSGNPVLSNGVVTVNSNVAVSGNVTGSMNAGQYAGLQTTAGNATTAINGVSKQLAAANTNLANMNINSNWSNTNTQVANFTKTLNSYEPTLQTMSGSMQNYNQDWKNTNQQFGRLVDLMQQEMAPGRLFVTAGATAAGAVVGAQLATMAFEGLGMGIKYFAQLIGLIPKEADALKVQHFKELREAYEHSKDSLVVLENKIDLALAAMDMKSKFGLSNEQIVAQLGPTIKEYTARLNVAQRKLEQDISDGSACISQDSQWVSQLEDQLDGYKAIKNKLGLGNAYACNVLADEFSKIGEAEAELQHMRLALLDSQEAVLNSKDLQNAADHKVIEKISKNSESEDNERLTYKIAERDRKRVASEISKKQDQLVDRCEDLVKHFIKVHEQRNGPELFKGRVGRACDDFVHNPQSTNDGFLNNFDPSVRERAKNLLKEDSGFFSDAAILIEQQSQNEMADNQSKQKIQASLVNEKVMNATLTRSSRVSEGELQELTRYFESLKSDQLYSSSSGPTVESKFESLARDRERLTAVCGDDPIGDQLKQRAQAYSTARDQH